VIHATISGRLGGDPKEIRHESGGCNFSVACDHGFGDSKTTTWVDVTVWGKRGNSLMSIIAKGRAVVVRGELYSEEREGKTYLKLRADDVELVGPKPEGAGGGSRDDDRGSGRREERGRDDDRGGRGRDEGRRDSGGREGGRSSGRSEW